ncbi:MAG: transporter [Desulfobulbaceae bacterium]|nr:transporter [Desulfobulbaceae bacterium]
MKFGRTVLLTGLAAVFVTLPSPGYADYKGHHAPGGWGLQSGTQAPAAGSIVLSPYYSGYYADKLVDRNGNEINLTGAEHDITVNSFGLFGWWVSEYKILGANWGMSASMYAADNIVEIGSFESQTNYNFADLFIQPVNLGWHLAQADFMVTYGVYLPTGRYSVDGDDNTGLGMWTHEFGAGTTLYFDKEKKWHISAMGYFEIHSEKEDSDTQVGNILTIEGGIGRSWYDGALTAGLAYYGQWKLTSDSIGDLQSIDPRLPSSIDLNKSQLYGIGPEVNLPIILDEKLICAVTVRYQWEFDARSTLEGEAFNLYLNFPL